VSPEHIGTGVGRLLFDHAVRRAASLGAETVKIEADPNAKGLYRLMGAVRVGEISYPIDGQERTLPLLVAEGRNHRSA
jgi:GNAT superfamily N-acetyltransferase